MRRVAEWAAVMGKRRGRDESRPYSPDGKHGGDFFRGAAANVEVQYLF